jgi:3-hydroxybutyryl-CoA dehydrogenase
MAEIRTLAVLGTGTMGRGIAQLCAAKGIRVRMYDVAKTQLDRATADIGAQLDKLVQKGKLSEAERKTTLERLESTDDVAHASKDAELVIEAAPENMALKIELFSKVREHAPKTALLASNTSSLSLTELGQGVDEAARVIGLHFFNPPPVMPLLEIVKGLGTSDGTIQRARDFAVQIGKEAIVVRDVPGFASSRLGVILGAEAMRMLESGVASVADIDKAMELGYRHPMGPLKLTDLVGLDVRLAILEHLQREIGDQFRPPAILRQMVRAGRLGKKVGLGFYRWTEQGAEPAS